MSICFRPGYERSFGTYPLKGEDLEKAFVAAHSVGYRAFDTAQMYENEADLGMAIRQAKVSTSDLLITTKVHPDNYSGEKFLKSVETSLGALGVSRIDLLLLHWPDPSGDNRKTLSLLRDAKRRGLVSEIGVSNFTAAMMREAQSQLDGEVAINQVEFHPLLDQSILLDASCQTGIPLASFSSVARGEVFRYPEFGEIGACYGKTPAQVALRWILQKGVAINTMSTKIENMRANFDIMDFTLTSIDMRRIDALTGTNFRCVDKTKVPWAPEWDGSAG
ncbi:aldo/keto reductase [Rhizobium sp. P44RR-XXIV]|uniref:aldo/keto reductase n=1 Tax=Rhizobium sp. P44RR-XXIV TaxID=1921145 RepID=UPI000984AF54|nr:aldo/keto reductase [Rhizobium sp. P44RR-XXIV]TIX90731.1 aldo/keto reductase [Rhizobium sp. P44RR-XXIV]